MYLLFFFSMKEQVISLLRPVGKGLLSALSHPDRTRLHLVRSGWLRLDIRPDCTFQQGVTNNTTYIWMDDVYNPSNAKVTFVQSTRTWYSLDSSHWVFSDEWPCSRVPGLQSFSGFLHHFVLAKLAVTSRVRAALTRWWGFVRCSSMQLTQWSSHGHHHFVEQLRRHLANFPIRIMHTGIPEI